VVMIQDGHRQRCEVHQEKQDMNYPDDLNPSPNTIIAQIRGGAGLPVFIDT